MPEQMRFRVKFYQGERCWGVEHNQTAANVAALLEMWGEAVTDASEHVVIEQGNER